MIRSNGYYSVDVAPNGAIKVRPNDWLSKYSAAIYNNFTTLHVFAREDDENPGKPTREWNRIIPIQDFNVIRAGETIYHLPDHYQCFPSLIITAKPLMSEEERKRIILGSLKRDHKLSGNALPLVSRAIDIMGYTENALTILEVFGLVAEGGAAAGVGTGLGYAGFFLFPVASSIAIVNAWDKDKQLTGMRAVAYATTAWAFDDPMPPYPTSLRRNVMHSHPENVADNERAWNEARNLTVKNLNDAVAKSGKSKVAFQLAYRAHGYDERQTLVETLMMGFQDTLGSPTQKDMLWTPTPNYPN